MPSQSFRFPLHQIHVNFYLILKYILPMIRGELCLDRSVWFMGNVIDDWKVNFKWQSGGITWVRFKLYLIYTICISSCLVSLLVRNVIIYSLCVVCIWILWSSWTLCSGKRMTRWIALKNLVLKDVGTQFSDMIWHWCIGFYINSMKS